MNLTELEAAARAATPGPWFVDEDERPGMSWNRQIMSDPDTAVCFMAHSDGAAPARDAATARLIALANPQTILNLIEVVRAATKDAERYRWLRSTTNHVTSKGRRIEVTGPEELDAAIDAALRRALDGVEL